MKKILTKNELAELGAQIGRIEEKTAAELRIVIRHKKHWSERKLTARQVAEREFGTLGMSKTRNGTGILFFILVSEKVFELLADKGVLAALPDDYWIKMAAGLSEHFSKSNFFHGLKTSLKEIGDVLEQRLPSVSVAGEDLPNDVIEE